MSGSRVQVLAALSYTSLRAVVPQPTLKPPKTYRLLPTTAPSASARAMAALALPAQLKGVGSPGPSLPAPDPSPPGGVVVPAGITSMAETLGWSTDAVKARFSVPSATVAANS